MSRPVSQEVRETCRDDINDWVTVNDISKHEMWDIGLVILTQAFYRQERDTGE